jgi:hypothetical protein
VRISDLSPINLGSKKTESVKGGVDNGKLKTVSDSIAISMVLGEGGIDELH